jgi:hypothetical protein
MAWSVQADRRCFVRGSKNINHPTNIASAVSDPREAVLHGKRLAVVLIWLAHRSLASSRVFEVPHKLQSGLPVCVRSLKCEVDAQICVFSAARNYSPATGVTTDISEISSASMRSTAGCGWLRGQTQCLRHVKACRCSGP